MPRLSKRCDTLTPRMMRLHPFVGCFFDLPLKHALQILNVSHHTLDPIRRSMGMKKWPFVDIVRGKYCQRDEIVALRAQMMPAADTDMQQILCRVAASADEFWKGNTKRIERTRRRRRGDGAREPPAQPPSTPDAQEEEPANQDEPAQEPDAWPAEEEEEADGSFWNDMRDLFELGERAAAASEPCPERGLFPQ